MAVSCLSIFILAAFFGCSRVRAASSCDVGYTEDEIKDLFDAKYATSSSMFMPGLQDAIVGNIFKDVNTEYDEDGCVTFEEVESYCLTASESYSTVCTELCDVFGEPDGCATSGVTGTCKSGEISHTDIEIVLQDDFSALQAAYLGQLISSNNDDCVTASEFDIFCNTQIAMSQTLNSDLEEMCSWICAQSSGEYSAFSSSSTCTSSNVSCDSTSQLSLDSMTAHLEVMYGKDMTEVNTKALQSLFISISPGGAGCVSVSDINEYCAAAPCIYATMCNDMCSIVACQVSDYSQTCTQSNCPEGELSASELETDGVPLDVLMLWRASDANEDGCLADEDFESWCGVEVDGISVSSVTDDTKSTCCSFCTNLIPATFEDYDAVCSGLSYCSTDSTDSTGQQEKKHGAGGTVAVIFIFLILIGGAAVWYVKLDGKRIVAGWMGKSTTGVGTSIYDNLGNDSNSEN